MLLETRLRRFKCFSDCSLCLRPLTVLAGINGAGKTSVIQGLLLLRQAARSPGGKIVELNGPYGLRLGEALDVLNYSAAGERIELSVTHETGSATWTFAVDEERSLNLAVDVQPDPLDIPEQLATRGRAFAYLAAERIGPRDALGTDSADKADLGVGTLGQFTAQVLAVLDRQDVPEVRRAPPAEGKSPWVADLLHQTEGWMHHIVRPIAIEARWVEDTSVTQLRFRTSGSYISQWVRPPNIGFGVSYALPIVVAGLLTPKGGLLIVENPEAHLHPAGQSMIGDFLARVAADGVQVIVETHSDHVLNGLRVAVAAGRLPASDCVIHHFRGTAFARGSEGKADEVFVETVEVSQTGALSAWPRGFFDQIGNDLGAIARLKKGKGPGRGRGA